MKNQKAVTGKTLPRIAALGLAGAVLWCGSMPQVSAATLKDLFDEHYYADTYKDLKEKYGYDREALWNHYMQHGMAEGRPMNELFDVVKYKKLYADLSAAFEDNWDAYANHYLTVGAKEGRESGTDTEFNAFDYAARYADLQAFGDDVLALWKHYQTTGAEENREARSENVLEAEREAEAEAAREAAEKEEAAQKPDTSSEYTKRIELSNGGWGIEEYNAASELIKYTAYNKDGNITMITDNYKYTDGKLTESTVHLPDYGTYSINKYDKNGNQTTSTWYHPDGKISQINDYTTNPRTMRYYNYDENGVLTSVQTKSGTGSNAKLTYESFYDADGRITKTNSYDNNGNIQYYDIPVYKDGKKTGSTTYWSYGLYCINEYDANEKTVKATWYNEDGSLHLINDYTTSPMTGRYYIYDDNGVLKQIDVTRGIGSNPKLEQRIIYNTDGRIIRIYYYDDNGKAEYYTRYSYDANGNLKATESFNMDGSVRE